MSPRFNLAAQTGISESSVYPPLHNKFLSAFYIFISTDRPAMAKNPFSLSTQSQQTWVWWREGVLDRLPPNSAAPNYINMTAPPNRISHGPKLLPMRPLSPRPVSLVVHRYRLDCVRPAIIDPHRYRHHLSRRLHVVLLRNQVQSVRCQAGKGDGLLSHSDQLGTVTVIEGPAGRIFGQLSSSSGGPPPSSTYVIKFLIEGAEFE